MKKWIGRAAVIVLALAAGTGLGSALRGRRQVRTLTSQEAWLFSRLTMVTAQALNLELVCSGRYETARKESEMWLYSNLKMADDILRAHPDIGANMFPAPNIAEGVYRASLYARANGADPEMIQRAERLYAWLRSRRPPIR